LRSVNYHFRRVIIAAVFRGAMMISYFCVVGTRVTVSLEKAANIRTRRFVLYYVDRTVGRWFPAHIANG
jgi:hypothetical protein